MSESISTAESPPALSPGDMLQAAREKSGISVRDVADKMYLLPYQVLALEADDYSKFKGDVFCRGYIKTYAKLLDLEPATLLESYYHLRPKAKSNSVTVNNSIQSLRKDHTIVYGCLLASCVVIALLWIFSGDESDNTTPESVQNISLSNTESSENSMSTSSVAATANVDNKLDLNPENAFRVDPMVLSLNKGDDSKSSTVEPLGDFSDISTREVSTQIDVSKDHDNKLSFSFSSDSWVQVKDKDEKLIFADMKKASQTLELTGKAPFYIVLGYAPGVIIEYNNQQINIPVNNSNNSARFVVGETQ